MKKLLTLSKLSALGLSLTFLVTSCAPNNPQTRIEKNPQVYQRLSSNDKAMASQGRVKKGMAREGVFIAWGKPARISSGSQNGKSFERWVYTNSVPVYHTSFSPYFGYGWGGVGYGRYGRHGWRGGSYGIGYNPSVTYVQRPAAYVNFRYNKVADWSAISR